MVNVKKLLQEHVLYLLPRPNSHTVKRILNNLKLYGSFEAKVNRIKPVIDNNNAEINVVAYFTAYPEASIRVAVRDLGVSKSSIHRILRKHKMHPYSYNLCQNLKPTDFTKRIDFAEFLLTKCQEDDDFLKNIIWCDESKFTKNGLFNRHNSHYWSQDNLHLTKERAFQDRWQFNVFCAIRNNQIIALHFYDGNLNG
jgi:hypothetical protein